MTVHWKHAGLMGVALLAAPITIAGGEPAERGSTLAAQVAYSAVVERVGSLSFEYLAYLYAGPLAAEDATTLIPNLLPSLASPSFVAEWDQDQWDRTVIAARSRWHDTRPRTSAEMVRVVRRNGDAYIDIDADLLDYRFERPTADAEFHSSTMTISWLPMIRRVSVQSGRGDLRSEYTRGNAGYLLNSLLLSKAAVFPQFDITETDSPPSGKILTFRDRLAQGNEHKHSVNSRIGWLPTEIRHEKNGQLQSVSTYNWTTARGIGCFPASIATVRYIGASAYLWLFALKNPQARAQALFPLDIPPDTFIGDLRDSSVQILGKGGAAEKDWSPLLRLGRPMSIPTFPELVRDPGAVPALQVPASR